MRCAIVLLALAACHHDAGRPEHRPSDFALTVREGDGTGMTPVKTIRVASSGGEVERSTVPPQIVARFTPSAAQLDRLYAAYVAADLEHAIPTPPRAPEQPQIAVEAVADGRVVRFQSPRPHAGADAIAAIAEAMAPR